MTNLTDELDLTLKDTLYGWAGGKGVAAQRNWSWT